MLDHQEYDDFYHLLTSCRNLYKLVKPTNPHDSLILAIAREAMETCRPHLVAYEDQIPTNPKPEEYPDDGTM